MNLAIAVVGPTASGKTELAIYLAHKFNCEIISADSMQIYKELNIGTAKPSIDEMEGINHYMINNVSLSTNYSVFDYVNDANEYISEVYNKNKLPIICGGTGLYIDSLLNGINFEDTCSDDNIRNKLLNEYSILGSSFLYEKLKIVDPIAAENIHPNNVRRIIRALEVYEITGKTFSQLKELSVPKQKPFKTCYIGLTFEDRTNLYKRCDDRIDNMIKNGLVEEAYMLYKDYKDSTALQAIGYKEFFPYFDKKISLEEAITTLKLNTRHYAKRQLTWFRRNKEINWINKEYNNYQKLAENIVKDFINKKE